ncbi:hypothetical protein ACFRIB_32690 [Streptomyces mirabilis]|uniref:hypothetical protein n=1 Tax=Streptomyces mirabilis TaxID=68239 RepID=UPI0036A3FB69
MTAIFVLDVPENEGVVQVSERDPLLLVEKVGPYFRIAADGDPDRETVVEATDEPLGPGHTSASGEIVIDRRATRCRHAVWYSALAGLQDARIVQHDKNALRVVRR